MLYNSSQGWKPCGGPNNMKQNWKDRKAVSPVIATILMVAITVVLAAVLIVYMQSMTTPPPAGSGDMRAENNFALDGTYVNWTIEFDSVPSGGYAFADIQWQIKNSSGQRSQLYSFTTATSATYRLIDNGPQGTADSRLNAGDVVKIRQDFAGIGGISHGDSFIVKKSDNLLLEITLK